MHERWHFTNAVIKLLKRCIHLGDLTSKSQQFIHFQRTDIIFQLRNRADTYSDGQFPSGHDVRT